MMLKKTKKSLRMNFQNRFGVLALGAILISPFTPSSAAFAAAPWTLASPPSAACSSLPGKGVEIKGDFRGNHVIETAQLLTNTKLKKTQVVIKSKDAKGLATVLETFDSVLSDRYIRLVSPGVQKTWCGKSNNCAAGEKYSVELKTDAIAFGKCESAEELYYWDADQKAFTKVSVSD